jgi:hypothetical protein
MKTLAIGSVVALSLIYPAAAQDPRWDELANAQFPNDYPTESTRTKLLDERYFQRAVQLYLAALQARRQFPCNHLRFEKAPGTGTLIYKPTFRCG